MVRGKIEGKGGRGGTNRHDNQLATPYASCRVIQWTSSNISLVYREQPHDDVRAERSCLGLKHC